MKLLRNQDANLGGESSSLSDAGANVQTQQGAKDGTDVRIDTTATKEKGFDPQSIAEQIKAKYAIKSEAKQKPDAGTPTAEEVEQQEKKAAESLVLNQNETPEQKAERESKALVDDAQKKADATPVADEKLPFHKHPRFQQVITERNEFEQKVAEYKPVAERMLAVEKFCQDNGVPAADYDESIRLAALVRTNPQEALTKFKRIVEALEVQTGSALPTDLQTRVDDGKISLTDAQEIAKARLEASGAKYTAKAVQESSAQRAQQELVSSLDAWTQAKIKSDPSFRPKQQGQEDGKYELVTDKFLSLWQQQPPKDVQSAVRLVELAYKSVHDFIERNLPKPAQRRPLSPKNSVQQEDKPVDISKPGWAREVARRSLAKAG